MIISASRRTDIPAFYSKWFMNRVRQGSCYVPNPLNVKQVSQVHLNPVDVEAIVFWSKNPAPLLPHLRELDKLGFHYYFQFTLNAYPLALEPNVPSIKERIATFKDLSRHVGPLRVAWRYDPIIVSNFTPFEYHEERFSWIAGELRGSTQRVMVSLVDYYRKTNRRLSQLEREEDCSFNRDVVSSRGIINLMGNIATVAKKNDIEIFTCAEESDFSQVGVQQGKCIDEGILNNIWSQKIVYKKDPTQRGACLCMLSKDIGINDTCIHGCPYCYSTSSYGVAQNRYREHDPDSPVLWGRGETVLVVKQHVNNQIRLLELRSNDIKRCTNSYSCWLHATL